MNVFPKSFAQKKSYVLIEFFFFENAFKKNVVSIFQFFNKVNFLFLGCRLMQPVVVGLCRIRLNRCQYHSLLCLRLCIVVHYCFCKRVVVYCDLNRVCRNDCCRNDCCCRNIDCCCTVDYNIDYNHYYDRIGHRNRVDCHCNCVDCHRNHVDCHCNRYVELPLEPNS